MADEKLCGLCLNLDEKNKSKYTTKNEFWCRARNKYVEPRDKSCSYFILNPSVETKSSGCYITTIVVDTLGYEDNCELLSLLRSFRDNVLKTNIQYLPLLLQYDQIGPLISIKIRMMENNEAFALDLMQKFLLPCASLIKNEKYDEAIAVYVNMVMELIETFELPALTINTDATYNIETVGKGRVRQPITSEI